MTVTFKTGLVFLFWPIHRSHRSFFLPFLSPSFSPLLTQPTSFTHVSLPFVYCLATYSNGRATSSTSWRSAEWLHKATFLYNSVMEGSQRTTSRFVTLITLGHIVSRKAFEKICFLTHWLTELLAAGHRAQLVMHTVSWPVEPGSAPGNRQQKETKARKINSSVFC